MRKNISGTIYTFTFIALPFLIVSCTEVIDIDLNSANPAIVAEGYIEPDSLARVLLTYTTDYYQIEPADQISDARLVLTEQNGISETLKYMGDGTYVSENIKGTVNSNYTLTIELDEKEYTGMSMLLPPADITSISYSELLIGNAELTELLGYTLHITFGNIPEQEVYYALKVKKNGAPAMNTYGLSSSRVNSNGEIDYEAQSFFVLPGDTLDISVFSIDFDAYVYYSQLNEQLSGNIIMSPAPFNPDSNLGERVLGYFMARSKIDTTFVVPSLAR